MQFCWLQPEQRPTAEEVHLLLTYLCAQGSTEEEEFERRWRSLRPGAGGGGGGAGPTPGGAGELAAASSFPLLEQFAGDGFHADGDDVLTVTETSRGLNFEYKWEAGRGAEAFPPAGSAPSPGRAARLQELCALDSAPPGVVPVLSAHSPSVGSEYFIRLEEPAPAAGHDPDCADCMPSPRAPALRREGPDSEGDSDGSAAASLVMEPLLGHPMPTGGSWGRRFGDTLCRGQGEGPPCPSRSPSPSRSALMLAEPGAEDPDWGEAAFCPPFEDPLGTSPLGTSPGGESLGEAEGRRTAQHRHWSSNESANNNSARRTPQLWGPHGSPATEQVPQDLPEPSHPLAPEDPREPLLGLQVVSSCKEQGCRPDPSHLTLHLSAEAVAPAAGLATPLWAEAAIAGGDSPQAEPRLAGEAESTPGSQPPLPSIPSPSQEGAPLPAEAASAPTTLPASPATSSQTTATGAAWARDDGGRPPEPEAPGGTGEDVPEATPGTAAHQCCAGPRDEGLCVAPAACAPQKQVGTPGSLHVSSLASGGGREVFSPSAAGTPGGQPRALDSGYDTENYESPEFVLKEAHEPGGAEAFGTQLSAPLGSLGEKSPYRDSAYFSDLDAEPEPPVGPEGKQREVPAPGLEPGLEGLSAPGLQSARASLESGVLRAVPPLPLSPDPCPEPSACHADPELEAPGPRGPAQVPLLPSPGCSQSFLLTPGPAKPESPGPELQKALGLLSGRALQARTSGPCGARAPLCLALPGLPAAPESRAEEEEDSEDSDESDEELRCYSVQEPSEESEEEAPPVPVVVAESQSARNLRSLLKMPSLLSEAFCEDLERKKKAVSFFDDVTVYLFDQVGGAQVCSGARDPGGTGRGRVAAAEPHAALTLQESPTRELGDPFPGAKESAPGFSAGSPGSPVVPSPPSGAHESSQEGSAAPEGELGAGPPAGRAGSALMSGPTCREGGGGRGLPAGWEGPSGSSGFACGRGLGGGGVYRRGGTCREERVCLWGGA
ncbi:Serine/threonine-protein kinase LMTK1 [Galemys pyrenaicus]|uniref:Serine/threonine-protein kinase LMTK1 n=1 Tax=Galemys pyrenaicus TaxID=202257 RepID=A0A8J6DGE9_GALPY|nr:Serine/threonine-protein kinase LMTK1 [Galemys pyrenaicus]